MFAIVGSGFGLYGYLPAVAEAFGEPVLLPESYRAKVEARPELQPHRGAIRWTADSDSALDQATGVVIATPPRRQVEVAMRCLARPRIGTLVLEKPLAPTAGEAHALLDALRRSGRRYRLGYTFLHTAWARNLSLPPGAAPSGTGSNSVGPGRGSPLSITWTFMAHHFVHRLHNWKRVHAEGGGALRFFGVHLLALLARHGYRVVKESTLEGEVAGEPERWRAAFSGDDLPDCRVLVDTRCAKTQFRIGAGVPLVDLADPYADERVAGGDDRRVGVLKRFLASLEEPDAGFDRFYGEVDQLWRATEAASP